MLITNKFLQSIILNVFMKEAVNGFSFKAATDNNSPPLHPTQPAYVTRQAVPKEKQIYNKFKTTKKNYKITIDLPIIISFILLLSSISIKAQEKYYQPLPEIILEGYSGGNIDGTAWKSRELINKINLILYVAPDQQKSVEGLLQKVDSLNFPADKFEVSLILNTSATWIPNSLIETKVRTKAKEDSSKNYILDKDEILLNKWKLADDNPNIILINKKGTPVFIHLESITENITDILLNHIKTELNSKENLK